MRTGKLSISRGHDIAEESAPCLALVPPETSPAAGGEAMIAPPPARLTPDYHLVHDRLTALERLTRLFEQGALSAEEFAAEKLLILSLPADDFAARTAKPVSFVPAEPRRRPRGPSLLARLLGWKLIPLGLVAGLGLSFASQPDATIRFFDETLRLFGI